MEMGRIQTGQSAERQTVVTQDQTINRMGREGADVLSTPALLSLMEWASIEATDHLLPEGYTTVGYAVDGMRHLAPTAVGATVRVKSVLTEVDGSRLAYTVEAYEGETKIGVATHKRAVIPTDSG